MRGSGYDTQTSSDIRWVYVVWPRRFNCICHRGVAAIAESVHLMISKQGRKGGAWPHPKQHHPVHQGPPFSNKCWLAIGSRPAIPPHSFLKDNCFTPCCHIIRTRAHLISFGAEQYHPIATISTSSPPVRPYSAGVHCLINWHAFTFDRPRKHLAVFKVTPCRRHDRRSTVVRSIAKARARNATPNRRQ
jgi:hypothetical protein